MLASKLYSPTLRELPADAVVMSHKYMLKAGMMRKIANGTYAYLPLACRAIEKVKKIIREEINKTGAQEILMPIVQPARDLAEDGTLGRIWRGNVQAAGSSRQRLLPGSDA